MRKTMKTFAAVLAVSALMSGVVYAAGNDKLVVNNASSTAVFKVQDDGTVSTGGFYYDGTTKYFGMGTTAPVGALSVSAFSGDANRGVIVSQHTSNAAGAVAAFRKSRGGEGTASTTVAAGDYNGAFIFKNYDGTNWVRNAGFGARVSASGTVATGSVPTELFFWNNAADTSDAYGSGSVRMIVGATGNVGIGTLTPAQKLEVNGGVRLNTATSKPTCDATVRGTFWLTQGAAGVKDALEICAKDAADAYSWRTLY